MNGDALVRLRGIRKTYPLGRVVVQALDGVELDIGRGELVALAGPSGSGKTTLMNVAGCVDKPDQGSVVFDGVDVTRVPLHRLAALRREALGFVFQTFNLLPVLTAWENVELPLLLRGMPARERKERVGRWLEAAGIAAQAKQRPDQLSGGQRQRVAIARAMAGDPKLVLADEPTANLDSATGARILDLLAEINRTSGCTFLFATHDPALIARARRVVRLHDGRVAGQSAVGSRQSAGDQSAVGSRQSAGEAHVHATPPDRPSVSPADCLLPTADCLLKEIPC